MIIKLITINHSIVQLSLANDHRKINSTYMNSHKSDDLYYCKNIENKIYTLTELHYK